jgi:hypothetical protein
MIPGNRTDPEGQNRTDRKAEQTDRQAGRQSPPMHVGMFCGSIRSNGPVWYETEQSKPNE